MRGSSQKKWLCSAVTSNPLLSSADITGLTSSCNNTRSPIMTSISLLPLVMAIQPPNPNGVGVFTFLTVTFRSFRGMLTFSTLSLKSPWLPSVVRTSLYSAGVSWARTADTDDASTSAAPAMTSRFINALLLCVHSCRCAGCRWCVQWQGDAKHGTANRCIFDLDLAAVRLDGPLRNRQTQTCSATLSRSRLIDTEETVEDPLAVFGGNAGSAVDDFDDGMAASRLNANVNRDVGLAVFDRVVHDVADRLPQHQAIHDHVDIV